jgi:heme/copper-type cytochrome/quinol oxidase subunit 2
MLTTLDLSAGGGHASAHLDISRSAPATSSHRLGLVALALVMPVVLLLGSAALAGIGVPGFDLSQYPRFVRQAGIVALIAIPVVALALLALAGLRMSVDHSDGRWHGRVSLQLAAWGMVAALLGFLVLAVFVGHLAADGFACATGVRSAC